VTAAAAASDGHDEQSPKLLESDDEIQLTSAPDCGLRVERFLDRAPPELLSLAALEVLSIVAYEQTRHARRHQPHPRD